MKIQKIKQFFLGKWNHVNNKYLHRLGRWRWPFIVGIGIMLLLLILLLFTSTGPKVATTAAEFGEFVIDISQSGELFALKSVSAGVPNNVRSNLRIVSLVEDGTMVQQGDFLVQFDVSEANQELEDRRNEYESALAELASLRATIKSNMAQLNTAHETQKYSFEQSKLRYEQMKYEAAARQREQELNLKKADLALEQAKKKLDSQEIINKADLTKANLKVRQARLRFEQKQQEVENLTLRAPIGGLVVLQEIWGPNGRAKVKVGDTPWRGMTLVEIPDLTQMMVKAKVNEVNISQMRVGQQVIISIDALPGANIYGKVNHVAALATRERDSDVKVFDVEVMIDGTDPRLRPGMTAQCRIITDRIADKLFVPLESVLQKDDTTVVYVKRGGFKRRPVRIGAKNSNFVVIEQGLKKGDEVALRDPTLPVKELGGESGTFKEKQPDRKRSTQGGLMIRTL